MVAVTDIDDDDVAWGDDSSHVTEQCPAKAAANRLNQFTRAWSHQVMGKSMKSITTSLDILKLNEDDLHVRNILGNGGFSTVLTTVLKNQATGHFDNDVEFALKKLRPGIMNGDKKTFKVACSDLALETKILANLKHKNIIRLHATKEGDMYECLKNGKFFIVLDLLHETLDSKMRKWKSQRKRSMFGVPEHFIISRVKDVALGIVKGMDYMHKRNILFRDLKPGNIGFDRAGNVKIFDFGLAREYHEDLKGNIISKPRKMTGQTGTPRYMAPEVARMDTNYGYAADVYSFSVLLWEIITSRIPFKGIRTRNAFERKVVNGSTRPSLKYVQVPELKYLIEAGWCPRASERPSFSSIKKSLKSVIRRKPNPTRVRRLLRVGSFGLIRELSKQKLALTENTKDSSTNQKSARIYETSLTSPASEPPSVASTVRSDPFTSPIPSRNELRRKRSKRGISLFGGSTHSIGTTVCYEA